MPFHYWIIASLCVGALASIGAWTCDSLRRTALPDDAGDWPAGSLLVACEDCAAKVPAELAIQTADGWKCGCKVTR